MFLEPLDFSARLAALIPKPRVNLIRYHGVFAPNSAQRAAMTWIRRLKRVFNIDIETCEACGGKVKIIACSKDPTVLRRIVDHLDGQATRLQVANPHPARAPPQLTRPGLDD